jgi:predicted nucleotide-binding protein (sugar kinase/HSP70/actin superfamily)
MSTNDTCYPALLVIGQMISALKSGKYDLDLRASLLPRPAADAALSTNIHLLAQALKKAGFEYIR